MKTGLLLVLVAAVLMIEATAQDNFKQLQSANSTPSYSKHGPDNVVARISYSNSYVVDWENKFGSPRFCFELYDSGYYRLSRLMRGGTETLQGTLSESQFADLRKTLNTVDFPSNRGGIVSVGVESFVAEIVRHGETTRFTWIDPDNKQPLPKSAASLVKWLQTFKPENAFPLHLRELSNDPLCPPVSVQPAPVIANIYDFSSRMSCGTR